ncbi:MAG: T9SS type A sorting domain-containing protein [Chryseobacterium sp.]|jgi:hypothetical protein|uniref:T9SS type A sorting domain-containing protein n=1 Tax=Chryseobacterium sp. TaxID=1871047 RepID=UPI00282C26AF|nr:T9SS type A sorting domain-containing protein [Chryseobacterium sp.]MDR2235792.1 T9SS type A sorting domain-containing protein [Chryseobacterium sp.]
MKRLSTLAAVAFYMMMDAQYCSPAFQYGADSNMITHVSFGNINNTSPFLSGSTPVYEDFTSISTELQAGNSYLISVKGPSSTFPSDVVVFIDFNKNGSFDDAGESFYIGRLEAANPANAFTVSANITVPANASSGATRMRVLKNNNTAAYSDPNAASSINTACDTDLRSGQAEDYTVTISGNNTAFPAPYCGTEGITSQTVSEISRVEFAGKSNDSNIDGNSEVLENFTDIIFDVNRGGAYPITVTGGTHGQTTVSAYAYIDFNHNNVFEANEAFNLGYLDNSDPVDHEQSGITSGMIDVPADALLGPTRFRLVKAYESSSWMGTLENLPCPSGWFIGQAEDYTINVQAENLATAEVTGKAETRIFPNPTTGSLTIRTEKLEKYEIYDLTGRKIQEGKSAHLNIESLSAGIYLIKIHTGDHQIITEKIIKK